MKKEFTDKLNELVDLIKNDSDLLKEFVEFRKQKEKKLKERDNYKELIDNINKLVNDEDATCIMIATDNGVGGAGEPADLLALFASLAHFLKSNGFDKEDLYDSVNIAFDTNIDIEM